MKEKLYASVVEKEMCIKIQRGRETAIAWQQSGLWVFRRPLLLHFIFPSIALSLMILIPYLIQSENHQTRQSLHTHTQTTRSNGADTCKISESHMHALVNTPSNTHCIIACRNNPRSRMQRGWKACMSVRTLIRLYKQRLGLCCCDRLRTNE